MDSILKITRVSLLLNFTGEYCLRFTLNQELPQLWEISYRTQGPGVQFANSQALSQKKFMNEEEPNPISQR